jgi:hypothetical protein
MTAAIDRPSALLDLARKIAAADPAFQEVRGPGDGNRATNQFIKKLQEEAGRTFGNNYSEQKICGDCSFAVDF